MYLVHSWLALTVVTFYQSKQSLYSGCKECGGMAFPLLDQMDYRLHSIMSDLGKLYGRHNRTEVKLTARSCK
jgi:predicted  nucleic acid-binding Zn-ribbon protein